MEKINVGVIGLGCRGISLLEEVILLRKDVCVKAVCDVYEDRIQQAQKLVETVCGEVPFGTADYRNVINCPEVEVIVITTGWESHVEIAVCGMKAGKAVAMEVGGAYTVDDCWDLVNTWEETKTPFMFLENCCFGRRELMVLNMVQQGLLGDIVHCSGGYQHDLRDEISWGKENRHYRLRNYLNRNAENYPTHELGPIAKILKINQGNRLVSLTSTASRSAGLHEYIMTRKADDPKLVEAKFCQGDIVTTVITCAHGETITLTLDTTLPRYYSRGFTVRGTKGMYEEATDSVFLDRKEDRERDFRWRREACGNAAEYAKSWDHPIWKEFLEQGVVGTHGGMDWLEFEAFFECLRSKEPMPVDVYDAAAWMAVTALSEESIAKGSAPVAIPDFTRGKWMRV